MCYITTDYKLNCDPERIRTFNQQNRNLPFYPIELRGRITSAKIGKRCKMQDAGCKMQDAGCKMQDAGCRGYSNFDRIASISRARTVFSSSVFLWAEVICSSSFLPESVSF